MDDEAEVMLRELGRRARERLDETRAHGCDVPMLEPERRRAMLAAIGARPIATRTAPPRHGRLWIAGAGVLVAAAAVVVLALRSYARRPAPASELTVIYDLELAGGRAQQLAAPSTEGTKRYRPDDVLVVRMRPRVGDPGPRVLSLRARAEHGGAAILVPALVQVDDGGALELRATLGTLLPIVPGFWRLEVGVGLPGACEQDSEDRCTWASTTIEIVDDG